MLLLMLLHLENCIDTFVLNRTSASGLLPWGRITANVSGLWTILSITNSAASHWSECNKGASMAKSLACIHFDSKGTGGLPWRGNGTNLLLKRWRSKLTLARVAYGAMR